MTSRPAVSPHIPQVEETKTRGPLCVRELNIRRYCFMYFCNQSLKDVFFQLHTRVHNVTFHNYLFLINLYVIRAN